LQLETELAAVLLPRWASVREFRRRVSGKARPQRLDALELQVVLDQLADRLPTGKRFVCALRVQWRPSEPPSEVEGGAVLRSRAQHVASVTTEKSQSIQ